MDLNALLAYLIAFLTGISVFALVVGLFANNKKLLHEREMDDLINNIVKEEIANLREASDMPKDKTWSAYWYNLGIGAGIEQTSPHKTGLIALSIAGGLFFLGAFGYPRDVVAGAMIGIAGLFIFRMFLRRKSEKRMLAIDKQLPGLLSGMRANLSAHMTAQQSILAQVDEIEAPLGDELKKFRSDLELNMPLDAALQNLSNRVPSNELKFLVASMRIAISQGVQLDNLIITLQGILTQRAGIRDKLATAVAQAQPAIYITAAAIPGGLIFSFMSDPANRVFWFSFIGMLALVGIGFLYAAALFTVNKQIQKVKDA